MWALCNGIRSTNRIVYYISGKPRLHLSAYRFRHLPECIANFSNQRPGIAEAGLGPLGRWE